MSCDNCSDHNSIVLDVLEEIRDQSYTEEDESDGLEVNLLGWDWIDKAFLVAEVAAAYVVAVYRSDGRCDSAHTAGLIAAWRHQEDSDVDATELLAQALWYAGRVLDREGKVEMLDSEPCH